MRPVIDSDVLVDHLRGHPPARRELGRYERATISIITFMEILVGARTEDEDRILRAFLARFEVLPLTPEVSERAIEIRRKHRIRLPDAVIWATAQVAHQLLVTRNARDFPADDPTIRIPYQRA